MGHQDDPFYGKKLHEINKRNSPPTRSFEKAKSFVETRRKMNIKDAFGGLDTPKMNLGYGPPYENNFEAVRGEVKTFCELGVNHGQSLIGWSRYFPNAQIIGVELPDNGPCVAFTSGKKQPPSHVKIHDRIKVEYGDAMDSEWLKKIANKYGGFDIVLDDCSHQGIQMKTSFLALWEFTKFVYAVEDLHTQMEKKYAWCVKEENFIKGYIQSIIKERKKIKNQDVTGKTNWNSIDKTIRIIKFDHNVIFIHK